MISATVVALLHPGAMGASLGGALVRAGHEVRWLAEGRSAATRARAEAAGLNPAASWAELLSGCEVVVAVCPPDAAAAVAGQFAAAAGPAGEKARIYVDANAVSPRRAKEIAALVTPAGANFVDSDIVGPPIGQGRTCLYLSGAHAGPVAALFRPDDPLVVVLGDDPTAASALKMVYAGWTKATSALLLTLWAAAVRSGVADALAAEWAASQPDLAGRLQRAVATAVPKAWRFAGEMDEITQTLADMGLPTGFHQAAAQLYRELDTFKDRPAPTIEAVLAALPAPPVDPASSSS